jgi:hypothetical protein
MTARHWLMVVVALCGALAVTGAEAAAKKKAVAKGPPPVAQGCTFVQAQLPRPHHGQRDLFAVERKSLDSAGYRRAGLGYALGPGLCGTTSIQVTSWKANKNIKCKG